jgi:hypothetical protein
VSAPWTCETELNGSRFGQREPDKLIPLYSPIEGTGPVPRSWVLGMFRRGTVLDNQLTGSTTREKRLNVIRKLPSG